MSKTLLAALCMFGALIFFSRLHTYDEPLERDLTTYAVIAHELLNGKALYTYAWDHKPPAIHLTYALGELIAGYGRRSIFLINIVAGLATLVGCYFAGSAGSGGQLGGLTAAAVWALISGDLAIHGNQPNTEVFLNAFLANGFALIVRSESGNLGFHRAMLAGLFFGIASLYKQVVVIQAALLAFAYLATRPAVIRRKALMEVAIIALIGATMWGAVLVYFFAHGRSAGFTEAVFTYNRWYSGDVGHNLAQAFALLGLPENLFAVAISMATLSLAGLILGLVLGPWRPWMLLLAFSIATHVAVLLPGRFFPHYHQLWLPPLAIGAGWTIALLKRSLPVPLSKLAYVIAIVVCAGLFMFELPDYRLPASSWSVKKYGDIFLETDRFAHEIDNLLPAGASFYEWGNETGLYFTSQRRPSCGIISAYATLEGPLKTKLSARLLDDLKQSKPELIVIDNETAIAAEREAPNEMPLGHPVLNWIKQNYRLLSRTDLFLLFARNGGSLDH